MDDARETTDDALERFLDSLPSTSGKKFLEEKEQRRKNLREQKWRRFARRARGVVAVSEGGAVGIVAYGLAVGVPHRDIILGALSVFFVGPIVGIVATVMMLLEVAQWDAARRVLGGDRAASHFGERPWTTVRWLAFGGPIVYAIGTGFGVGKDHGSPWGAVACVLVGVVLALIVLVITSGSHDGERWFD